MNKKTNQGKTARPVQKPFLTGSPADERIWKDSLLFFGGLLLSCLFSFLLCTLTGISSTVFRIVLNAAVIAAILVLFFNAGTHQGSDAVARGEILYQKEQRGTSFSKTEKDLCFHPLKGFLIGLIGTLPLLILTVIFSLNARAAVTGAGALPSWMQAYTRRNDIAQALVSYLKPEAMSPVDYMRIAVRICIMPYVNLVGYTNKAALLVLEKLSPLIILLPAASFGTGYLSGRGIRTRIHTAISESNSRRIRKEKKARAARQRENRSREPESLN